MKGSASACLTALVAAFVAGNSCTRYRAPATTVDLLARGPDDPQNVGVHVDLAGRRVRLEPGAEVSYRIDARTPGIVHLKARADHAGTLEAEWFVIDVAGEKSSPAGNQELPVTSNSKVEKVFELPSWRDLLELRLAWRAPAGAAQLELLEFRLEHAPPIERPSIILVVIDTLSAEHLSTYGYPLLTDPELVRLASESFLFEHCYSNAPWTVPSFMALMTGIYALSHQLPASGPKLWQQWYLARNRWTLAEAMRAAGYRTAAYVDNSFLTMKLGFDQGFDVYDETASADNNPYCSNLDGGIRMTAARASAFLEAIEPSVPGFVFVHAFDVHGPYTERPPPDELARGEEPYDLGRTAPVGGSAWTYEIIPTIAARVAVPEGDLPAVMHVAPIERAYDQSIRFLDEEIGKFFDHLRATGALDRSWLIFTADHGETMGEGVHYFGHGLLTQEVVHVPLLVRPPGGVPGGKRIADAVQLTDLYPTLMELAGLEDRGVALHGRSLVPLLRGEARAPHVVLTESGITRQSMLVSGSWKLVELEPTKDSPDEALLSHPLLRAKLPTQEELDERHQRGRRHNLKWLDDADLRHDFLERMPATGLTEQLLAEMKTRPGYRNLLSFVKSILKGPFYELYDLEHDPGTQHDVAAQYPQKVAELRALLEREQQRRKEAWKSALPPSEPVELLPEEIQALEDLGYGGAAVSEDEPIAEDRGKE